mmetsp:Transcript_39845/g.78535  ORF Transcript_39845/g.78535 Transcript_39845/m.78535 type:complete len:105 (-) Transcript_39845:1828-2142(-)
MHCTHKHIKKARRNRDLIPQGFFPFLISSCLNTPSLTHPVSCFPPKKVRLNKERKEERKDKGFCLRSLKITDPPGLPSSLPSPSSALFRLLFLSLSQPRANLIK